MLPQTQRGRAEAQHPRPRSFHAASAAGPRGRRAEAVDETSRARLAFVACQPLSGAATSVRWILDRSLSQ